MTFVDYHNGDNLGLEPTATRQVTGEYLTLVFEKPISPAVRAIFAAQEWVAASHYDALQERDNYAREVAELRAENKRLREELSKMRGGEPSDEEIDAIAASMPDGAGGMLKQWGYRQFARALLARYGKAPAADGDARPGYAGVSVWVGNAQATQIVSKEILELSNADELMRRFEKARAAIDAAIAQQRTSGGEE